MASGGATGPPSLTTEKKASLTCALCLDVFTHPKLLPCHHTFCLKCLQNIVSEAQRRSFKCPQCCTRVYVPCGGVEAFQDNFYMLPAELEKARRGPVPSESAHQCLSHSTQDTEQINQCLTHPKQDLDLYCADCKLVVCLKCVLTKHKLHTTKDLSDAASEAKTQLNRDQRRLQAAVSYMITEVQAEESHQQFLKDKKASMKAEIHDRHSKIVAMADGFRSVLLTSLKAKFDVLEKDGARKLNLRQKNLGKLCQLQQQVQEAVKGNKTCQLLDTAKEMADGRGSVESVGQLTVPRRQLPSGPVLDFKLTEHECINSLREAFASCFNEPASPNEALTALNKYKPTLAEFEEFERDRERRKQRRK